MKGALISLAFCILFTRVCDTIHSLLRHVVSSAEQISRRCKTLLVKECSLPPPFLSCRPGSTCWSSQVASCLIFSLPWFSEPRVSLATHRPTPTGLCRSTCWIPCSTWFVSSQPASLSCPGMGFDPRQRK